jgi:hypothetical protein
MGRNSRRIVRAAAAAGLAGGLITLATPGAAALAATFASGLTRGVLSRRGRLHGGGLVGGPKPSSSTRTAVR